MMGLNTEKSSLFEKIKPAGLLIRMNVVTCDPFSRVRILYKKINARAHSVPLMSQPARFIRSAVRLDPFKRLAETWT